MQLLLLWIIHSLTVLSSLILAYFATTSVPWLHLVVNYTLAYPHLQLFRCPQVRSLVILPSKGSSIHMSCCLALHQWEYMSHPPFLFLIFFHQGSPSPVMLGSQGNIVVTHFQCHGSAKSAPIVYPSLVLWHGWEFASSKFSTYLWYSKPHTWSRSAWIWTHCPVLMRQTKQDKSLPWMTCGWQRNR